MNDNNPQTMQDIFDGQCWCCLRGTKGYGAVAYVVPSTEHQGFYFVAVIDLAMDTIDTLTKPVAQPYVKTILNYMNFECDGLTWQTTEHYKPSKTNPFKGE